MIDSKVLNTQLFKVCLLFFRKNKDLLWIFVCSICVWVLWAGLYFTWLKFNFHDLKFAVYISSIILFCLGLSFSYLFFQFVWLECVLACLQNQAYSKFSAIVHAGKQIHGILFWSIISVIGFVVSGGMSFAYTRLGAVFCYGPQLMIDQNVGPIKAIKAIYQFKTRYPKILIFNMYRVGIYFFIAAVIVSKMFFYHQGYHGGIAEWSSLLLLFGGFIVIHMFYSACRKIVYSALYLYSFKQKKNEYFSEDLLTQMI